MLFAYNVRQGIVAILLVTFDYFECLYNFIHGCSENHKEIYAKYISLI